MMMMSFGLVKWYSIQAFASVRVLTIMMLMAVGKDGSSLQVDFHLILPCTTTMMMFFHVYMVVVDTFIIL